MELIPLPVSYDSQTMIDIVPLAGSVWFHDTGLSHSFIGDPFWAGSVWFHETGLSYSQRNLERLRTGESLDNTGGDIPLAEQSTSRSQPETIRLKRGCSLINCEHVGSVREKTDTSQSCLEMNGQSSIVIRRAIDRGITEPVWFHVTGLPARGEAEA